MSNSKSITAKKGEDLATEHLIKKGYKILERNWRYSRSGEIDIIAQKEDEIVFVEVKTRTSTYCGDPLESITISKRKQIYKLAEIYLSTLPEDNNFSYRFDVIGLIINKDTKINHLENALSTDF